MKGYALLYFPEDQSFTVSLYSEPLAEKRIAAEQELLALLGITSDEACLLRHVVMTPWWVSEFYSGKNLGFSFCPGATKF